MSDASWSLQDFLAKNIVNDIKSNKITVPLYQRGQVWDKSKEEKFIESIKLNYPFGSILLYKKSENDYHLIDGLQRCTTLYKYIENPAKFFDENLDADENVIDSIFKMMNSVGNEQAIKEKIKSTIKEWVINNHSNMSEIENIRSNKCADYLVNSFPSISTTNPDNYSKLDDILNAMFIKYKDKCKKINDCPIPAIVYSGDDANLPEIFARINSKGVTLNKYQILAATWTTHIYKIKCDELKPILTFVSKFYSSITSEGFSLANYNQDDFFNNSEVNLYQLLFGFGKLLNSKYPRLFGTYNENKSIESSGFNLINACLLNKNSNLNKLPYIFDECLQGDDDVNTFFVKVLGCIDEVYNIIKPYLEFKLNSRGNSVSTYHTEMQICSAISNMFIARYINFQTGGNDEIIGRTLHLNYSNQNWDQFKSKFKQNFLKVYVYDMLNDKWAGTGDKNLDSIAINRDYYTKEIAKDDFSSTLDIWLKTSNETKQEFKKVASVSSVEKMLLSIIYCNKFTAHDQLDNSKYDIEHLCTKNLMAQKLARFNGIYKLPISSFGNICLLPQWDNRKKKDKTLYQDQKYLSVIGDKLNDLESKYTFTTKEMMEWLNTEYNNFNKFKEKYMNFINTRFEKQKNEILEILYK